MILFFSVHYTVFVLDRMMGLKMQVLVGMCFLSGSWVIQPEEVLRSNEKRLREVCLPIGFIITNLS